MKSLLIKTVLILASGGFIALPTVFAQPALVIKPLSEKKVANLPVGPLSWRIENFSALDQAQSAAGPWSLVAESTGKIWLFTLGQSGGGQLREAQKLPSLVLFHESLRRNIFFE